MFLIAGKTLDPKELKRQRDRERYARNKDEILKKRRESRKLKKVACAIQNGLQTPSNTLDAISTSTSIRIFHCPPYHKNDHAPIIIFDSILIL
jgi:hypothetical protein